MENKREKLYCQLVEQHGKVVYTYTAHHKIADRLQKKNNVLKVIQIVLTAISTVGFLATVISNQYLLAWVGGVTAALSLGLNLYLKDNKMDTKIGDHKNASDDLWYIREKYASLITDFDDLSNDEVRNRRDELVKEWNDINKKYPGTDKKGYLAAQQSLKNEEEQTFNKGEAEQFLPTLNRSGENNDV